MPLLQMILIFGCVVIAVFFLLDAIYNLWSNTGDRGSQRIKRRLGTVKTGVSAASITIKKENGQGRDSFPDIYFKKLLLNADSDLTLKRLYFVIGALTVSILTVLASYVPYLPFSVDLFLALICGIGVPTLLLKSQVRARCDRFEELFPDAIELIVRSLRIGQPLSAAIRIVADEMPDPIGKEFFLVAQEVAYGKDLPDAIEGMTQRIPTADLRFFAIAVQIQHESGGNLAEILEGLSKIIRGRYRLMRKVRALTVEGRFSAWFLSFFPVIMIVAMNTINPGYYQKVADFSYFDHLVILTAALLLVNVIAMQIMTKLKV